MNTFESVVKNANLKIFRFDDTNNVKCGDLFLMGIEYDSYRIIDGDYSVYRIFDRFDKPIGYKICHPNIELFISSKTTMDDFHYAVDHDDKKYFEELFHCLISKIQELNRERI